MQDGMTSRPPPPPRSEAGLRRMAWPVCHTHLEGVGACAIRRITDPCHVALVQGSAGLGVAARARASRAGVGQGAGVAIIAGRVVWLREESRHRKGREGWSGRNLE